MRGPGRSGARYAGGVPRPPDASDAVLSHRQMCAREGVRLRRGMNFRNRRHPTIALTSTEADAAPYRDRFEPDGTLLYEGHDQLKGPSCPDPKAVDQPEHTASGGLTQNGLFRAAALAFKAKAAPAEPVRVYDKLGPGRWVFRGTFLLTEAWREHDGRRRVFRFRLDPHPDPPDPPAAE